MQRILISACLMGMPVRYDGRGRRPGEADAGDLLARWRAEGRLVPICPEVAGGFAIPRRPAEIAPGAEGADVLDGRAGVFDDRGGDVTAGFLRGAQAAVALARRTGCGFALLTEASPSCGVRRLYSGAFDGRRRPGAGVTAAALRAAGLRVFGSEEIAHLAAALRQAAAR
jgi:uncharacterized protein YbbK (DUF523 family)